MHTVGQGSVLLTADQLQTTTSFPTCGEARIQTMVSEVGGECLTTASSLNCIGQEFLALTSNQKLNGVTISLPSILLPTN